jgi:NAD(P)H-hydrate repair Nnr-like enzyme with NAD(P)H-hydrate dehydratase domain
MIGSLLAQGYEIKEAAINGVLAHALAAKKFSKNNYALTPQDIIKEIKCL